MIPYYNIDTLAPCPDFNIYMQERKNSQDQRSLIIFDQVMQSICFIALLSEVPKFLDVNCIVLETPSSPLFLKIQEFAKALGRPENEVRLEMGTIGLKAIIEKHTTSIRKIFEGILLASIGVNLNGYQALARFIESNKELALKIREGTGQSFLRIQSSTVAMYTGFKNTLVFQENKIYIQGKIYLNNGNSKKAKYVYEYTTKQVMAQVNGKALPYSERYNEMINEINALDSQKINSRTVHLHNYNFYNPSKLPDYIKQRLIFPYLQRNLRQIMDQNNHLPFEKLEFLKGMALALVELHSDSLNGESKLALIHKDIKPENFMMDAMGKVILIDLGFSTTIDSVEFPRAGTPGYASPEAYLGKQNLKSDMFSLGVIGYELLTRHKYPFEQLKPPSLDSRRPHFIEFSNDPSPDPTKQLILRLLDLDPVNRPDASEVVQNIDQIKLDQHQQLVATLLHGT